MIKDIKLTQYSHGAGCGCKISPKILDEILSERSFEIHDPNLLVGNNTKDDAAVYALDDENAIISTTDFFMPIVDDPFDFGAIADQFVNNRCPLRWMALQCALLLPYRQGVNGLGHNRTQFSRRKGLGQVIECAQLHDFHG